VTLSERVRFYEQLATMARAGVSLRQSLVNLSDRFPQAEVRRLSEAIQRGESTALAFEGAGFRPFETSLVEAGEKSGRLEVIYQQLAAFWKEELELQGAVKRRLVYPFFLLHLAAFLGPITLLTESFIGYVFGVMVRLALMYGLAIAAYAVAQAIWKTAEGQRRWLRLPLIGPAIRDTYAYRWTLALSLEFSAGIPLPQAVADAWRATGYHGREERATEAQRRLDEGEALSALIKEWPEFIPDWRGYVETGEYSGKLEETLTMLRDQGQTEWKRSQEILSEWLPKILYFGVIILVLIQIFAAFSKYFSLINTLTDSLP
jgi:type II secretory pathway component PulF